MQERVAGCHGSEQHLTTSSPLRIIPKSMNINMFTDRDSLSFFALHLIICQLGIKVCLSCDVHYVKHTWKTSVAALQEHKKSTCSLWVPLSQHGGDLKGVLQFPKVTKATKVYG